MRVLLPVDGSKWSDEAVRAVITAFRPEEAQVRVLSVIEPIHVYLSAAMIPHIAHDSPQIEAERKQQANELVRRIAETLRKAGFAATQAIDNGDPRTKIIDHATKWDADLIVVGSHGLRGLAKLMLGSVSEAVMRHAKCSVQVVRMRIRGKRGGTAT